jgi:hypothetical protein
MMLASARKTARGASKTTFILHGEAGMSATRIRFEAGPALLPATHWTSCAEDWHHRRQQERSISHAPSWVAVSCCVVPLICRHGAVVVEEGSIAQVSRWLPAAVKQINIDRLPACKSTVHSICGRVALAGAVVMCLAGMHDCRVGLCDCDANVSQRWLSVMDTTASCDRTSH